MTPRAGATPQHGIGPGQTPIRTPVRDKLNINAEGDTAEGMYNGSQSVSLNCNR